MAAAFQQQQQLNAVQRKPLMAAASQQQQPQCSLRTLRQERAEEQKQQQMPLSKQQQQSKQRHQHLKPGQLQRPDHQHQQQQQSSPQPLLLPLPAAAAAPAAPAALQRQQRSLFCALDPPLLTNQIKQCTSWVDVAVLFAKQSQCMNHINLAALLTHLAHLPSSTSSRPVNWRTFIGQVLAASEPQLGLCGARQLSNMAWALTKLGFHSWVSPTCSWSQQWRQRLLATLCSANCRDVTNIWWALAASVSSSSNNSSVSSSSSWAGSTRVQPLVLQQQELLLHGQLQAELLSALHRTLSSSSPQVSSRAHFCDDCTAAPVKGKLNTCPSSRPLYM